MGTKLHTAGMANWLSVEDLTVDVLQAEPFELDAGKAALVVKVIRVVKIAYEEDAADRRELHIKLQEKLAGASDAAEPTMRPVVQHVSRTPYPAMIAPQHGEDWQ